MRYFKAVLVGALVLTAVLAPGCAGRAGDAFYGGTATIDIDGETYVFARGVHRHEFGGREVLKFTQSGPSGWTLEIAIPESEGCESSDGGFLSVELWGADDDEDYDDSFGDDISIEVCIEEMGSDTGDRTKGTIYGELENDYGRVIFLNGDFEARYAESLLF